MNAIGKLAVPEARATTQAHAALAIDAAPKASQRPAPGSGVQSDPVSPCQPMAAVRQMIALRDRAAVTTPDGGAVLIQAKQQHVQLIRD